jgi:hypothetical protein
VTFSHATPISEGYSKSADDVCSKLEMLILINENDETEATITNGQSRDIGNIVHTRHKTKIKKNTTKKHNTTQEKYLPIFIA